ncbi:MAG: hypothetical protein ABIS06_12675 [Vicinamibacterales bacterium]
MVGADTRRTVSAYANEIIEPLAERRHTHAGPTRYTNVHMGARNGYAGWPEKAPFDRIVVTAASDEVAEALVKQLKVGARMAIPVGTDVQELKIMRRTAGGMQTLETLRCGLCR